MSKFWRVNLAFFSFTAAAYLVATPALAQSISIDVGGDGPSSTARILQLVAWKQRRLGLTFRARLHA